MGFLYFDSSAIVKRYLEEKGSLWVRLQIRDEENTVYISSITRAEVAAALGKRYRFGDISEDQHRQIYHDFQTDVKTDYKKEIPLIDQFLKRLTIAPERNTRLVKVHFESHDPSLAAQVTNAIGRNYIQVSLETKFSASQEATRWLGQELETLKKKMEESERALQRFMVEEKIVSVPTLEKAERITENIVAQRLTELNTEVTRAKAERIGLETLSQELVRLSRNSGMIEAIPDVINNLLVQQLKAEYAKLYGEYSQLAEKYGPKHPSIVQSQSQLKELEDKIALEVKKIARSIETQYKVARAREETLLSALEGQKQETLDLNKKVIRYGALKREVETNKQIYDNFLLRLKETSTTASLSSSNIRIVDPAEVPRNPVKPRVLLNLLLAIISGLTLGIGLAFFFEYLENTLRTPEDIENYLEIPCLGVIGSFRLRKRGPDSAELITLHEPQSNLTEAFRQVRTNVLFSSYNPPRKVLLVTSVFPQEGKTLFVANLALTLAQTDKEVLLLDTDMRRPRFHRLFEVARAPGLSQYLINEAEEEQVIQPTQVPHLSLAPCGDLPPNPSELLGSERMAHLLKAAGERFDYLLLDSPPLFSVTDALILAGIADGIVLVVKASDTARDPVQRSLKQLQEIKAPVIGAVLNQVDLKRDPYYYHYYRYDYGHEKPKSSKAPKGTS